MGEGVVDKFCLGSRASWFLPALQKSVNFAIMVLCSWGLP